MHMGKQNIFFWHHSTASLWKIIKETKQKWKWQALSCITMFNLPRLSSFPGKVCNIRSCQTCSWCCINSHTKLPLVFMCTSLVLIGWTDRVPAAHEPWYKFSHTVPFADVSICVSDKVLQLITNWQKIQKKSQSHQVWVGSMYASKYLMTCTKL